MDEYFLKLLVNIIQLARYDSGWALWIRPYWKSLGRSEMIEQVNYLVIFHHLLGKL